jgi:hypothetical protein
VGHAMVAEFLETVPGRPEDGWQVRFSSLFNKTLLILFKVIMK